MQSPIRNSFRYDPRSMVTVAYAMPARQFTKLRADLAGAGYYVRYSAAAGTCVAELDEDATVPGGSREMLRALRTPAGWLVRAVPGLLTPVGGGA